MAVRDLWFAAIAAVVVAYAFLMQLVPVGNDDVSFQLNTARWIIERGEIPWTDVFSYTAQGRPWVYPVGGSMLLWMAAGYAALSVLGALGCAAATGLVLRKGSAWSVMLATWRCH